MKTRTMRLCRTRWNRLAVGSVTAILGASFTLGAVPALAATGTGPVAPDHQLHHVLAPVSSTSGSAGTLDRGTNHGQPVIGAATQVSLSGRVPSGATAWPALPLPSGSVRGGSMQSATSASGGAYTALSPTRILDTRTNGETLGPGASLNLTVTGGTVPSDATAVALNVTVTDTTAASYLSVYPSGGSRPVVSNLNWVAGETVPNLVIVPVGAGGQVTFYNHSGQTNVLVDLEGYFAPETSGSAAGSYVPLVPARITDTRAGSGFPNAGSTLVAGGSLNVQVTGAGGVPTTGVTAVLMNLTVTDTTASSFLTAYPTGGALPTASNLNWVAGQTVANRVVVPVSSSGQITLYNHAGQTDVIVDVDGYFINGTTAPVTASLYVPITPVRVLDTRQTSGPLGAGATISQQMGGVDAIGSNASAVVSNVTAVNTTAASYFTVYPTGTTRPTASDVNWTAGQIVPNLTVATLSSSGAISIYNHAGSADVVVDAFGYFSPISTPATALTITTSSLPGATVGTAYSATVAASGGTPPYTWALTSGSLPAGLSLSSTGVIAGTPTTSGSTTFGVRVTDSATPTPDTATASLSISVTSTTTALTITTSSLPGATVGTAYSATLTASGGTPPYTWALTSGSLPAGLSLSSSGVVAGTPSAAGTSAFTAQVTDSATPTPATAIASLSLVVYLGPPSTVYSTNWSGYALQTGPYTAVTGTFNVPSIYTSSTNTDTAEWVGIDGASDTSLIQAGIDEPYDAATNTYLVQAWWEILPAPETLINMTVSPGDSITVTIREVSGTEWSIAVTDNTSGASFTTDQSYSAPLSSAEWIVEAPTLNGSVETVGAYSPDVTFTGLEAAGPQNTLTDWVMVQNGVQVSTPSALDSTGFNVAHGDVAPAPP